MLERWHILASSDNFPARKPPWSWNRFAKVSFHIIRRKNNDFQLLVSDFIWFCIDENQKTVSVNENKNTENKTSDWFPFQCSQIHKHNFFFLWCSFAYKEYPFMTKPVRSRQPDIGLVLFCLLLTSSPSRSINTQNRNLANIQSSWQNKIGQ